MRAVGKVEARSRQNGAIASTSRLAGRSGGEEWRGERGGASGAGRAGRGERGGASAAGRGGGGGRTGRSVDGRDHAKAAAGRCPRTVRPHECRQPRRPAPRQRHRRARHRARRARDRHRRARRRPRRPRRHRRAVERTGGGTGPCGGAEGGLAGLAVVDADAPPAVRPRAAGRRDLRPAGRVPGEEDHRRVVEGQAAGRRDARGPIPPASRSTRRSPASSTTGRTWRCAIPRGRCWRY